MVPLSRLPEYFSERGWTSPGNAFKGPFQYAVGTDMHIFDYLETKPKLQQAFNTTMTISGRRGEAPWYTYYPVNERLNDVSSTDALLVDVGGGQGADLVAFKKAHPNVTGKLILEDQPAVIASADAESLSTSGIEAIPHDFFRPQPVKNARCYYLRTVLHDWPDLQALEILGHIKEAMGRGSVLLIEDRVLPEKDVPLESALADWNMMVTFASMERRLAEWVDLLAKAGFRLVKLWRPEGEAKLENTALLEAVRENEHSTRTEDRQS